MRNLSEIIEAVKTDQEVTEEELRYGLLAISSLLSFDHRQLREELTKEPRSAKVFRDLKAEDSFNRYRNALNKSPKEWLGWGYDPKNPEYQKFHEVGSKLVEKFTGQ